MATNAGTEGPLFASPAIAAVEAPEPRQDGSLILRSAEPLGDYPVTVVHSLRAWAQADPSRLLVAERGPDGAWLGRTYGAAVAAADAIGQALLDRGLGPGRPLLVLSGNSVDHLLVTLGAMTAGVPVAPVSVAYSLQSRDHARIKAITELIRPGAVFAEDAGGSGRPSTPSPRSRLSSAPEQARGGAAGRSAGHRARIDAGAASGELDGDAVAKILFTSGSTGSPKGVINTHRMLASNQQMIRQAWPFLRRTPGDRGLAAVEPHVRRQPQREPGAHLRGHPLRRPGRPDAGLFAQTVANLTDVPPTIYFNVPAGYAQLVPALENDPAFAARSSPGCG